MKEFLKTIFIDTQLIGIIIGFVVSYFFYKLSRIDTRDIQRSVWRKEFDKSQIDKIIDIFEKILLTLLDNKESKTPKPIDRSLLIQLRTQAQLNVSFNEIIKNKIDSKIYKECLFYNEIKAVQDSITQTEPNVVEKEKREVVEKNITEVIDEIKSIFSEF